MNSQPRYQSLKLVTAPAALPVAVADVKTYLRINTSDDDAMLSGFIEAATDIVEKYTGRRLITQTWAQFMDAFPQNSRIDALPDGVTEGAISEYVYGADSFELLLFPVQSITHLKTYDPANTAYTMSSSDYFLDTASEPCRLALANDASWPTTLLRAIKGIEVQFVVGYGASGSAVPFGLKQAIMEIVGKFYSSRGCSDSENAMPATALALLQSYRVMRIGAV